IDIVVNVLALGDGTHDVRLINTVPSALSALLESSGLDPAVEVVNVAGEALKRELVERLFAQTQARRLYNLYGPSETTTYSSWVCMDRQTGFQAISAGRSQTRRSTFWTRIGSRCRWA
ncbi:AMP-binding protein, partial [Ralstonia pseudosolanacearum]|uniref:AMP-binding protein n=1 Tax=Ralstonia pseudosolanacearum TaxID=1310165 RepID=UPI0022B0A454